jgi:alpha-L-arabinofuranosidase
MIYFDSERCFGTASYYLWKLFSEHRPSYTLTTSVTSDRDDAALAGRIGVGTWGTSAEFKDVRVEKGGQVLYEAAVPTDPTAWQSSGGRWQVEDGVYRQARESIGFSTFGDPGWSDYTLTLKARKISGNEGFLILIGTTDEDRLWWNLGGWGNREHGVELNQAAVGPRVEGTIEAGRWYDIRVELESRTVRCHLDGRLIHEATVPPKRALHALAGVDQNSGELVLKVINTASVAVSSQVDPGDARYQSATPRVIVLTSDAPGDNNSLDEPQKVRPVPRTIAPLSESKAVEFPPSSLTIIRISQQ